MISSYRAQSDLDYESAALLFREYARWLDIDLSFQRFDEELNQLKVMYGEPGGAIFLSTKGELLSGCVAIRRLTDVTAELKRMYIVPQCRNQGIAESLLKKAITFASQKDYQFINLDTLDNMLPAISLYKKFGFCEVGAYYFNPHPNTLYFQKVL